MKLTLRTLGRKRGLFVAGMLILALVLAFTLVPGTVYAGGGGGGNDTDTATAAAAEECTSDYTFYLVLNPNETREVPINAFCMDRGKVFPGNQMRLVEEASAEVQTAIRYSVDQGYTEKMPELWSVQLAVWNLEDGKRPDDKYHKLADEIIAYAKEHANDKQECVLSESISLADAVKSGLVEASIDDFKDVSPSGYDFFGSGTLVVKNLTDQVQVLNIPYGTRFEDEVHQGVQNMAVFPKPGTPGDVPPKPEIPATGGLLPPEITLGLTVLLLVGAGFFFLRKRSQVRS
jgi:hypothetical protein